jgi:uncharacterized protein
MIGETFYGPQHRALQDRFETRPLADRLGLIAANEIDDERRAFIESRDLFFLSTVDHEGRPTVSYKGGAPGFVQVIDPKTLLFPSYDGNGMYLSMGNVLHNPAVGLLFIDFERPQRLRVQGEAVVSSDPADLARFPEAELAVRVTVTEAFTNCPRYVHRHGAVERSRYVPQEGVETPFASWKRIDVMNDVLPEHDAVRARELGLIDADTWSNRVRGGDLDA